MEETKMHKMNIEKLRKSIFDGHSLLLPYNHIEALNQIGRFSYMKYIYVPTETIFRRNFTLCICSAYSYDKTHRQIMAKL